jgi:DNA helicase-2/ATP-dependent DNA helicase PcrA
VPHDEGIDEAPDDDEFIGEAPELMQPVGRIPPWAATGRGAAGAPPQTAGAPLPPPLRPRTVAPARARIPGERYFRDGDRVLHPSFGEGIVVTSKLTRHDEEVTIAFAGSGVKTLAASIANLEVQG